MQKQTITEKIRAFAEQRNLPFNTCRLIDRIFGSAPARAVQSRHGNIQGRYPSEKIGATIQYESGNYERAHVILLENDPRVVAYCDQPSEKVRMRRPSASGRQSHFNATADFFVVSEDFVGWEEVKPEPTLNALSAVQPHHYVNHNGLWVCPPGEAFAAEYGLAFRIVSDRDLPRTLVQNLEFLGSYRGALPSPDLGAIVNYLNHHVGVNLLDLRDEFPQIAAEVFFEAIANNDLYVDLQHEKLKYPDQVHVFACEALGRAHRSRARASAVPQLVELRIGSELVIGGTAFRILALNDKEAKLVSGGVIQNFNLDSLRGEVASGAATILNIESPTSAGVAEILSRPKIDTEEAIRRLNLLEKAPDLIKPRTKQRWEKAQRDSIAKFGEFGLYGGLLPNIAKRGNRTSKLSQATVDHLISFIAEDFEAARNAPVGNAFVSYLASTGDQGIQAVSRKTFGRHIKARDKTQQIEKRLGARASYQIEPFYHLSYDDGRHGDHPWHIAHIDHTQIDVINSEGEVTGRAWLTVLVLAYSRRVAAFRLSYESPSWRAIQDVLLTCIELHCRLPAKIITDNGPEFRSENWLATAAFFRVELAFRPPHHARVGSVIERIFGTTNAAVFHGLRGNTQILKRVRQVTMSRHPVHHSVWSLPAMAATLADYFYEIYDQAPYTGINATPREMHAHGLLQFGHQHSRQIVLTEETRIVLLPRTSRPEQKIHRGGIIVSGRYYWHHELRALEGEKCEVRYDPADYSIAYAHVGHRWIRCVSDDRSVTKGMTVKEFEFLTKVFRAHHKKIRQLKGTPTAELIAFAQKVREKEYEELKVKQFANLMAKSAALGRSFDPVDDSRPALPPAKIRDAKSKTAYDNLLSRWEGKLQ